MIFFINIVIEKINQILIQLRTYIKNLKEIKKQINFEFNYYKFTRYLKKH